MIQINLLSGKGGETGKPAKEKKAATPASSASGSMDAWQLIGALILIVGLVGVFLWGFWLNKKKTNLQRTLAQKRVELKNYEGLIEKEKKLREQKELLEKKENTIISLKDNQSGPFQLLEEIFNRCPDDVWFESITQKGNQIVIKGRAKNTESANRYYQYLSKSKIVTNIEYPLLKKDEKYRIPNVVFFEITFTSSKASTEEGV